MATKGTPITLPFAVRDVANNQPKVGETPGTLTLRWVKDGVSAAPTNAPAEIDAANAKGQYKVVLTAAECTCDVGMICGVSSNSGVEVIDKTITFEPPPDALLDLAAGVEAGLTFRQFLRLAAAVLLGKSSGGGSVYRDTNDTKARVTATVDSGGNRTSVSRDPT